MEPSKPRPRGRPITSANAGALALKSHEARKAYSAWVRSDLSALLTQRGVDAQTAGRIARRISVVAATDLFFAIKEKP